MEEQLKITLRGVSVIFANLVDDGFGKSITIDATDKDTRAKIEEWVKANNIGKAPNTGKANFKEYTNEKTGATTLQYAFKMNDNTKIVGVNGLTSQNLGFGATVSLVAKAFDYDNKFGVGTSGSLSAVVVEKAARTGADDDLDELLGGLTPTSGTDMGEPLGEDEPIPDFKG